MSDLIGRDQAIEAVYQALRKPSNDEVFIRIRAALKEIPTASCWIPFEDLPPDNDWIPIKTRPMDEEERIEWSERLGYDIEYEEAVIYVSRLPDDGEEVLTCNRYGTIRIDTFSNDPDYGCCFEENGDMDGIVAWMPLPEPYKEEA